MAADKEFEELLQASSLGSPEVRAAVSDETLDHRFRVEFKELFQLGEPTPDDLRRMAELVEILCTVKEARPFWVAAARAGDQDAIDYLEVIDDPVPTDEEVAEHCQRIGMILLEYAMGLRAGIIVAEEELKQ